MDVLVDDVGVDYIPFASSTPVTGGWIKGVRNVEEDDDDDKKMMRDEIERRGRERPGCGLFGLFGKSGRRLPATWQFVVIACIYTTPSKQKHKGKALNLHLNLTLWACNWSS